MHNECYDNFLTVKGDLVVKRNWVIGRELGLPTPIVHCSLCIGH